MILSWLKYLEENPLKMLTMQRMQMVLVLVVAAATVEVLVKAAAVIVNKLTIPLFCEHLLFCESISYICRRATLAVASHVVAFIKVMWSGKVKQA